MTLKEQYERNLKELINDKKICKENRDLFKKFFQEQEYKLKRKRGLTELNDKVLRTLVAYIPKFRNTNIWFKNKPLKNITKQDIKRVYDSLEDGKYLNINKKPFKDKESYYNKIFKSKLFKMVGKDNLAREVIETFHKEENEVRYITEEDFKKAVSVAIKPKHKLILWLAWDIGENVFSLVQLKKKDCKVHFDSETKEKEYLIRLSNGILKTSRTARTEPTLYPETTELLDIVLKDKKDEDYIFDFGKPQADKVWKRCVELTGIKTEPDRLKPTIKDLRSGMACHLLDKGWTTDEIKARMGHKPSSSVIDKYANYKAIGKKKTKRKIYDNNLQQVKGELERIKNKEKLSSERILRLQEKTEIQEQQLHNLQQAVSKLIKIK